MGVEKDHVWVSDTVVADNPAHKTGVLCHLVLHVQNFNHVQVDGLALLTNAKHGVRARLCVCGRERVVWWCKGFGRSSSSVTPPKGRRDRRVRA